MVVMKAKRWRKSVHDGGGCEIVEEEVVPLLDGSAKEWVEAIKQVGLCVAEDQHGYTLDKLVPELHEPLYLWHGSSFLIAFPSQKICITYGIDFPKVPSIGCQWFSSFLDESTYTKEIASSRTFCVYEEVEGMCRAGLCKGGSADNAIAGHALHTDFIRLLSRSSTELRKRLLG
ncbi:hypothetical protein C4D60_Mb06t07050 [Musa balbisiana]|uniref:UDP-3-O-acyl-N-acetylglucosamine deacetylase n=1 Tax=Musa balbisiana TaxID=52838 RepID=A0A4S8ILD4_MUSBA|nr:hypothetical protein C4D60_Mb06t07050 [Musa balbisiana]